MAHLQRNFKNFTEGLKFLAAQQSYLKSVLAYRMWACKTTADIFPWCVLARNHKKVRHPWRRTYFK